jgi:hypothetical protein
MMFAVIENVRSLLMSRRVLRFAVVGLFTLTWMLGVVIAPGAIRGASAEDTFSAAENVLSQSGTLGLWWLPQPPGFPPLKCVYPTDTTHYRIVNLVGPVVYPVQGISSQEVRITVSLKRRLPDGSLQFVDAVVTTGTATNLSPVNAGGGGGGGGAGNSLAVDLGSTYVETVKIEWLAAPAVVMSHVELLYTQYQTTLFGSPIQVLPIKNACFPEKPATASLASVEGTVGSSIPFTISRFPNDPSVGIYFDGKQIGSVATDTKGNTSGKFIVPAAPMGKHTVKFYRYGRSASVNFTIKPRIKIIPSSSLKRGQTVNVSLRGFAKYEMVSIRWKKGSSWVQVSQVETSSTGSANINVTVPKWVPDGATSVRGDGSYGHAQTNAVSVAGGPFSSSSVKTTPSPTPAVTASPTEQLATPEAVPSETSTPEPTETAMPAVEPTEETPATETPSVEPTIVPTETPAATTTETSG